MPGRLHDADYAAFIEHLRAERQRLNVTQSDLSQRLGRPQSYVSKIERLERRIDIGEWRAILLALGVDPTRAFGQVNSSLNVAPTKRS